MKTEFKDFLPCKGSRTIGKVIEGLGYNVNAIIFDNASLPDDTPPPSYNNMVELSEVGNLARDKFDMLNNIGDAGLVMSGMAGSQSQLVE